MARTTDVIDGSQFIDLIGTDYRLETVTTDNILSELELNEDEVALTKSIILSLEEEAAKTIKAGYIAQLPHVGTIQKDVVRDVLNSRRGDLNDAKKVMNKEEYKEFARQVYMESKNEVVEDYNKRKIVEKYKRNYKKLYTKLVINRGKLYADIYIEAILNLKSIPFDRAVQDQYDKLNGRWED